MKLILITLLVVTTALCEKLLYNDYKVYRVTPDKDEHIQFLSELQSSTNTYDFWSDVKRKSHQVDIMVPPHKINEFEALMRSEEIQFQVTINDVQKVLDKYNLSVRRGKTYGWDTFYGLDETYAWLRSLAVEHADKLQLISIGKSYEKRDILAVKISTGGSKKSILLDGGFHAREWSGVSTATYLINELLTSKNPEIKNLSNSFDWYIIPVANPDGYTYSHTNERFWRKTRKPYGACFGADPNRNFDVEWVGTGTAEDPCLLQYAGPEPFSEPETRAFANFVNGKDITMYITLHSYGQVLLYPYGYTWRDVENVKDYKLISEKAVEALAKKYSTKYEFGSVFEIMYRAHGNSIDWMSVNQSVPLNFVFELRDKDDLDPKHIIPCAEEVLDAIVSMFRSATDLGYFKN